MWDFSVDVEYTDTAQIFAYFLETNRATYVKCAYLGYEPKDTNKPRMLDLFYEMDEAGYAACTSLIILYNITISSSYHRRSSYHIQYVYT